MLERSSNAVGNRNNRRRINGRLSGNRLFTDKVLTNRVPPVRTLTVRNFVRALAVRGPSVRSSFVRASTGRPAYNRVSEDNRAQIIRQSASEPNPTYPNSSINALAGRFVKQSLKSHKEHGAGKWVKRDDQLDRKNRNKRNRQTIQKSKINKWIDYHFISTVALNLIDEILFF